MKHINNNLFTEKFLKVDLLEINDFNENIDDKFSKIKSLFNKEKFESLKEAQLEKEFISIVLEDILGFSTIYQITKQIQGKLDKPDFALFESLEKKENHYNIDDNSSIEDILLFCESKAYDIKLDNGKIDFKNNPHFQLMHYLTYLRVNYGILTNGRFWRFYNVLENRANKVFFEIDLESIISDDDRESFKYFYHIFKVQNFKKEQIETIIKTNENTKLEIEEDLKSVIYGKESIIELIAKAIYTNSDEKNLKEIFNNSIYLTFRLLFIAYFENKFEGLLKTHKYYNRYSLEKIYQNLISLRDSQQEDFSEFRELKELFRILNYGDKDVDIPLLNGGLFDYTKASLLNKTRLIDNKTLKSIISKLLYFNNESIRRDFKTLSVIHIGNIYEGLLEFELRIAKERLYYVSIDGEESYYDTYDFMSNKKTQKSMKLLDEVEENSIYLVNQSNSRKSSASYYTPKELSSFMVKSSIDLELERDRDIFNIKILDNACGSGHFLVESLNYLTQKAFEKVADNKSTKLKNLIDDEKTKIEESIKTIFEVKYELDELAVLKRILLKRAIYGVDLNPFAIELTRLSLWIDTFIFGTPLSFIEHHIKVGNSLIGSTIEELNIYIEQKESNNNLFTTSFIDEYQELISIYKELDNLKDTTSSEVIESKNKYFNEIEPKLNKLNRALDFITYLKFKNIERDKETLNSLSSIDFDIGELIINPIDSDLLRDIAKYRDKYRFFNYDIEFPEIYETKGFDIIIGNPPWEVIKLDDKDFFSQFKSNYRTMKNNAKVEIQNDILSNEEIKKEYEESKNYYKSIGSYFKEHYKESAGVGNNQNLYRFFIEKNLSLLSKDAILTYLFPATFISEDGSIALRKYILENFKMNYFYGFENKKGIFKDVHRMFKFAIMQVKNQKVENQIIKTRFMQVDTEILNTQDEIIDYTLDNIKTLSPEHFAMLEIKNNFDLKVVEKAYKFNSLDSNYIDFNTRELNFTEDKYMFLEKFEDNCLPIYEGKMIWQFDSNFEKNIYWIKRKDFDNYRSSKEISRLIDDIYPFIDEKLDSKAKTVLEFFRLKDKEELRKFIKFDREFFRFGFRLIASNTNERTIISSFLPKNYVVSNSLLISYPKKYILNNGDIELIKTSNSKALFLNAIFNSIIYDYIARFFVFINVMKTIIMRLPIPQPSEEELKENPNYQKLIKNALLLTLSYNYDDFEELAIEFNINKKEIPKTQKQKDMLKIENDCIVAKLYNITKDELTHICSTFKVFNDKNPAYSEVLIEKF